MSGITASTPRRIPGEAGFWILILGDLGIFSLFFIVFIFYRNAEPAVFAQSHKALSLRFGLANTLLLLTSSLFVAMAVRRVRESRPQAAALFLVAILCGLGFVADKAFEWGDKLAAGINVGTNDFFMLYFAFTGIHLIHVLIGLGVLTLLARAARRPDAAASKLILIECGGVFWHLVDLVWIVLFALFYLMQ